MTKKKVKSVSEKMSKGRKPKKELKKSLTLNEVLFLKGAQKKVDELKKKKVTKKRTLEIKERRKGLQKAVKKAEKF